MALCEVCGKSFKRNSGLNQHIKKFHSVTLKVYKCSFCQRPFNRISNLRRHFRKVHKLSADSVTAEVTNCKGVTMAHEQLKEAKTPVYVTVMDDKYSDISDDYEDVSSDENEFEEMIRQDNDNDDKFSVNTELLNQMIKESGDDVEKYLDELFADQAMTEDIREVICDDENDIREVVHDSPEQNDTREIVCMDTSANNENPCVEPQDDAPVDDDDAHVDDDDAHVDDDDAHVDEDDGNVEMDDNPQIRKSVIVLCMQKNTRIYPNGYTEVTRDTNISHSRDIDLSVERYEDIALDILNEVPQHFYDRNVRVVEIDSDVDDN